MAVPKRRVCHSRKHLREGGRRPMAVPPIARDRSTNSWHRAHHVDLRTGMYNGRQVLFRDADKDTAPEASSSDKT